ncbi:MAG TPA: GreA/GreB family elongation factor, partial [Chitinophagaceae bacterium]|jgi:regulator of nucleoside diphosphate kinase|nr:GreA/GreB family elongation factor [Chitinophagaceae bacterium]
MQKTIPTPVIRQDDYQLLSSYIDKNVFLSAIERNNVQKLKGELERSQVVNTDEFPGDTVRLYSRVKIRTEERGDTMEMTLVPPGEVDRKANKISILAPISIALLGFRQGQRVTWKMPTGLRTYTILEVYNDR